VRAKKLGVRFRRQQVIAGFIVDFYCHKAALVVEVDGDIHDLQQEEDARREKVLTDMGLRIIRFQNDEIFTDLFAVVQSIRDSISAENHLQNLQGSLKGKGGLKALMEERRKESLL
jgi:very-short-patch-repair endonuclease